MPSAVLRTTKFAKILGHKKKGGSYSHFISRLRRHFRRSKIDVQWLKSDSRQSSGGRPLNFAELTLEHIESWLGYLHPRYLENFKQVLEFSSKGFSDLFKKVETAFNQGIIQKRASDKQQKAEAKLFRQQQTEARILRQQQAIAAPPQTRPVVEPKTLPAQPPIKPPTTPRRVVTNPYDFYVPYKPSFINYSYNFLAEVEEFYKNSGEDMPLFQGETISTQEQLDGYRAKMKNEPLFEMLDHLLGNWIFKPDQQAEFLKVYKNEGKALGYNPIARFYEKYSDSDVVEDKYVRTYFFVLWHIAGLFDKDWRECKSSFVDKLKYADQMEIWKKEYNWISKPK
ncbi:MAG: hypothetical protein PUP93_29130 [Rhizonema sp. NSF051]|nr:hypothetical protein [Rhizonema sp. NSF051]